MNQIDRVNVMTPDKIDTFLRHVGASDIFIAYCLKFPDCQSVSQWIMHWEQGWKDFGGHFGTSLFEGDIQKALNYADRDNRQNLVGLLGV